jgi:hypothetical protein
MAWAAAAIDAGMARLPYTAGVDGRRMPAFSLPMASVVAPSQSQ